MKMFKVLMAVLVCVGLTSCSALRLSNPIDSCKPTAKNQFVSKVGKDALIIKLKGDSVTSSDEDITSTVLEYDVPEKSIVTELRCILVAEAKARKDEKLLLVTAVFTKANVIEHFILNRDANTLVYISIVKLPDEVAPGQDVRLAQAQAVFPLDSAIAALDDSRDPKAPLPPIMNLGSFQGILAGEAVQDLLKKLSGGKLS